MELELAGQSWVSGSTIRLGDLLSDGKRYEQEPWFSIPVADAAGYGLTRFIEGRSVQRSVQGKIPATLALSSAMGRLRVTTLSDSLPAKTLDGWLETFFSSLNGSDGETITWEILRKPDRIDLPKSTFDQKVQFASGKERGRTTIDLKISSPDWPVRSYPILIKVVGHRPVRVATRRIERGEAFDALNTRVETREVSSYHRQGLPGVESLIGMRASGPIQVGRIITSRWAESQPLVLKGETASLVWSEGTVKVTAAAVCRESGAAGEVISIRNLVTSKMSRARIRSDGTLEPVDG
jgi:flagella basal body P-ring formation protein FlgA